MVSVIFPAAGAGRRMGAGKNKVLLELAGVPILLRSLQAFSAVSEVGQLIVVVAKGEVAFVEGLFRSVQGLKPWCVVAGGAERQYSVANGMKHLAASSDIVLVHDAARPLVSRETIEAVISAAREKGAAIAAVRAKNTIKVVDGEGRVEATPPREGLWEVQTPQGFCRELLVRAYEKAAQDGFCGTDDASLVERLGETVFIVESTYGNLKVTTPEDLQMAEALLAHTEELKGTDMTRFGMGYDVHRLVTGRKLIVGGVDIPHEYGLLGHSDADVLLHAVEDALLGAAALGDLGRHFPDSDARWKDVSSMELLTHVAALLREKGYRVGNIDATIVAQRPKFAPYIEKMRQNIAGTLDLALDQVNVKATTEEKLGFTGEEKGISAYAVASLERMEEK